MKRNFLSSFSGRSSSLFHYNPTFEELELLSEVENLDILNTIEEEGLKYIAGYAASKFIYKYENLGNRAEMSVDPENDWVNYISRGKLISPCSQLINVGRVMNREFNDYHESFLRKGP